ncbi:MAG: hypothetical protein ACREMH_00455 [Gemmatimonadales bacterium]
MSEPVFLLALAIAASTAVVLVKTIAGAIAERLLAQSRDRSALGPGEPRA